MYVVCYQIFTWLSFFEACVSPFFNAGVLNRSTIFSLIEFMRPQNFFSGVRGLFI